VARNRKRARDRQSRQSGTPVDPHPGLPTATHGYDNGASDLEGENGTPELEPVDLGGDPGLGGDALDSAAEPHPPEDDDDQFEEDDDRFDDEGAPAPLKHATPDVELAEEQLAVGRPIEPEPGDEEDEEEFEHEVEESISERGRRRRGGRGGGGGSGGSGGAGGAGGAGEAAVPGRAVAERGPGTIARLIGFLQGSWRELQRVQWPDRRQVMQATGVVIGFVIIAALFLGASDWVSNKIVTFVLK
jgi:preprotein translocase subunit SecE